MMPHEEMKAKMLEDPEIRHHYEHPDEEMIELDLRIKARRAREQAKMSQAAVARKMKTSQQAVARLGSWKSGKSPALSTLIRYAKAVGCEISFDFKPCQ